MNFASLPADVADLPVVASLAGLEAALDARANAVLIAPPGAGKTTLVPLSLLDAGWRGGERSSCWSRAGWPPAPRRCAWRS